MRTGVKSSKKDASYKSTIHATSIESTMGKHRNSFVDDEADDDKSKGDKRNDTPYKKCKGVDISSEPELVSPEKDPVEPRDSVTHESKKEDNDATIEALMRDSTSDALQSDNKFIVDKYKADVFGERLQGGLTIVYVNHHNSTESAYVMQAVTAISHNKGPFSDLGIKHSATCVHAPNSNEELLNTGGFRQYIFVIVNKHCPKLKEEHGLVFILETFAEWLTGHKFSRKDGLTEAESFCKYSLPQDYDKTNEGHRRKLGDIILLKEAIVIVKELFPTNLDNNLLQNKIIHAYFNMPYPEELRSAFHIV